MGDATNLDARPVVLQRLLDAPLHSPVVTVLLHVDEVDHDQARKIAQAQLAGHLVGGLQIGAHGGVFDIVLAGRAAGVHIDGYEGFGLVDDDIAARLQGDRIGEHGVQLRLDAKACEDRLGLAPGQHILHMGGHEKPHEVLGFTIAFIARDDHIVDVLVEEVADGALDERTLLIDEAGRRRLEGEFAHGLPHAQQIFEIPADFLLGAAGAGGAQDDAHALRHFEILGELLQALAVGGVGDLAGNAAAARGVGHQNRIAASERQIGGQRSALVAALFLHDLDEQHLTALDDFLDLVLAAHARGAEGHLFEGVAAELLDRLGLFVTLLVVLFVIGLVVVLALVTGLDWLLVMMLLRLLVVMGLSLGLMRQVSMGLLRMGLDGLGVSGDGLRHRLFIMMLGGGLSLRRVILCMRLRIRMCFGLGMGLMGLMGLLAVVFYSGFKTVVPSLKGFAIDFGLARHALVAAIAALGALVAAAAAGAAGRALLVFFLLMGAGFVFEQRLPVGDGDLVIVRMDFGKGQEPMTVAAVVNESGLKRGLHARHLRQIDIAAQLLLGRGLEVEFFYAVPAQHHNPSLLGMRCVDKHFVGHLKLVGPEPASPSRLSNGTEPRPVLVEGGEAAKGARAMSGEEGIRRSSPARRLSAPGRNLARFWMMAAEPLEHVLIVINVSALEPSRKSRRAALRAGRCVCA